MDRSKLALLLLAVLAWALAAGPSSAQTFTTLASFNGGDGAYPLHNTLTLSGSTLYGMTPYGGSYGAGNVFSIPVTGGTPTNLLTFNDTNGELPFGNLILSGSTLYGATSTYGYEASGWGLIFSMPVTGGTSTTLSTFYSPNLSNPTDLTLVGSTLYGTAAGTGANINGAIFSVPVSGGDATTIASFNGSNGQFPQSDLVLSGSNFYGTTSQGGPRNEGTIYEVPVAGGTPVVTGSFNGGNGKEPSGNLLLVGSTLYGTTSNGGAYGDGNLFTPRLAAAIPRCWPPLMARTGNIPWTAA